MPPSYSPSSPTSPLNSLSSQNHQGSNSDAASTAKTSPSQVVRRSHGGHASREDSSQLKKDSTLSGKRHSASTPSVRSSTTVAAKKQTDECLGRLSDSHSPSPTSRQAEISAPSSAPSHRIPTSLRSSSSKSSVSPDSSVLAKALPKKNTTGSHNPLGANAPSVGVPSSPSTKRLEKGRVVDVPRQVGAPHMGGCVTKSGQAAESAVRGEDCQQQHHHNQVHYSQKMTSSSQHHSGLSADSGESPTTADEGRSPNKGSPQTLAAAADHHHRGGRDSSPSSPEEVVKEQPLKDRDRRRLSLSQSDPAGPVQDGSEPGNIWIAQAAAAAAAATAHAAAQQSAGRKDSLSRSEDEESSLALSDEDDLSSSEDHKNQSKASEAVQPASNSLKPPPKGRGGCRRLSVSGMPSTLKQENFENKKQEVKSDTGYFDANSLLSLGIGYACRKGLKPESPNQDDFFIVRIDDWGLYGVFDGHGPFGHDVSNYVQRELPKLIYNDPNFHDNPKEALRRSFITVHRMLEASASSHHTFDCSLSGSTSTVVLHRPMQKKMYVAHVGDSRCILGRLSKNGRGIEAIDVTNDHKPNNDQEKRRIMAAGGQVRRLEGDIPYRVFLKGRLYPGLAMSRALGDTVGSQAGVICDPDVSEVTIDNDKDLFIAICSDGVWEFMDSKEVAEVIFSHGMKNVQYASDTLARESWNRWINEEGNVVDDITAEIIYLNPDNPFHEKQANN